MDEANNSGQSLREVIKSYAQTQYTCNQAYILCVSRDTYNAQTGEKVGRVPEEFLAWDPIKVEQLFDDTGEIGKVYGFTMEDRNVMLTLNSDKEDDLAQIRQADENNQMIYPAAYRVGALTGASGKYWLYSREEVFQDHWFRPSTTYGVPIWYFIMDDLKAWNALEKHFYKKYYYGFVRKVLFIPGVTDEDIDEVTKGITDVLAKNDNSIPIICMPPALPGVTQQQPQAMDLGTQSDQEALAVKNEIMNRVCAFVGVPNLFAGDVEMSGGMNNESQQITVFDRYLMDKLDMIDNLLAWVKDWIGGMDDWELVMDRPTKSATDAKKRIDKMQEAQMMISMGFLAEYVDGEFHYSRRPFSQEQMVKQAQMQEQAMQQQMMQQQMMAQQGAGPDDNGVLPGDGDGPPEKGSVRREDKEVDASKDEVDQTKREADL